MARWESDAEGRLIKAAISLFDEQGFQETTVAQIADAAGLTKRTFFRYFADKREVLFNGSHELQERNQAELVRPELGGGTLGGGVAEYALDEENAKRLWALSENALAG